MSKIDKIIQIIDNGNRTIVGLSESGVMYLWDGNWEHYAESPYREITKIELAEELAAKSPELGEERKLVFGISDEMEELVRRAEND